MRTLNTVIVGGGPAGLSAAVAAFDAGERSLLIVERDVHLGGILQQCIHNGFGLQWFKEELTGPEYAQRFIDQAEERQIESVTGTMVLEIRQDPQNAPYDKTVFCLSPSEGVLELRCRSVILSMGCRERVRGNLKTPGTRPVGIYSAGLAQRLVNLEGVMPGKKVVILGSGDIGLIMARRMTWEGAEVKMVCEIMPYSAGLARNIQQCLIDLNIPLHLSTTIVNIHGRDRLEGVTIARVDEKRNPIPGTEQYVECDTLLLSVGLLPENELSRALGVEMDPVTGGPRVDENRQTSIPGVYACGNVLHVHDIVDFVSKESTIAGKSAAAYNLQSQSGAEQVTLKAAGAVRYTVPQMASLEEPFSIFCRVAYPVSSGKFLVKAGDQVILEKKFIKAVPSEMEEIPVRKAELEKILSTGAGELTLETCLD
ncbi:MAG: FAD-dependent oxidoreductase [Lachnospiraceae bacterium]|nr:FAD-dependent oxidoreductase [Lachnospiraceae bacterium]